MQLQTLLVAIALLAALVGGCVSTRKSDVQCHKYLVLPPAHDDELASDAIAQSWMRRVEKNLKGCNEFIGFEVGKKAAHFISFSHALPPGERRLNGAAWRALTQRTRATDLIDLNYKVRGIKLELKPDVYVLPQYQLELNHPFPKQTVTKAPTQVQQMAAHRFWSNLALDFVPNSVTLGFTGASFDNERANGDVDDPYVTDHEEQRGLLPPIVSSFGFSNIKHPDGFGMFDYSTRLFGNSNFMLIDSSYVFSDKAPPPAPGEPAPEPGEKTSYDLWLYAMGITINGEISLFSPLGTTFLSLGFGPAFVTFKDSTGDRGTFPALFTRYVFGQRMFFADQWFVQLTVEQLGSTPTFVENETFLASLRVYSAFSLGYFFPESRSIARSFF